MDDIYDEIERLDEYLKDRSEDDDKDDDTKICDICRRISDLCAKIA